MSVWGREASGAEAMQVIITCWNDPQEEGKSGLSCGGGAEDDLRKELIIVKKSVLKLGELGMGWPSPRLRCWMGATQDLWGRTRQLSSSLKNFFFNYS